MMKRLFLIATTWMLASISLVQAQYPVEVAAHPPVAVDPVETFWSDPPSCNDPGCGCQQEVWFTADYLLWWIHNGPLNVPLVTTGSPLDAVPGALGQDNTTVLVGNAPLNFGAFSGFRLGGGFRLIEGLSMEGNYFGLERRAISATLNSDPNGNPVLARPFFDNQLGAPNAYLDALPGVLAGGVAVSARTRLQGYELNLVAEITRDGPWSVAALTGFRTLELNEDLRITDNVTALVPGVLTFLAGPADPPNSLTIFDHFHTYNRFYGGQIGGRVKWASDRLEIGATGKVALGTTQQLVLIDGFTNLNMPGAPPTTNAGGILAQPTNGGRFYQSRFGAVPEFGLDVGYWISPLVRISVGYQFMYWNGLARPGNQIDTTVNVAQVPRDPNFGNGLGDARPAFQFRQSNFWAQGIHCGLLFQY
jgi:hypothetical protein